MPLFEWDYKKSELNELKHGLSFKDAVKVFYDVNRIQYLSKTGNENRFLTVGKILNYIIAVVYTVRGSKLRIISARQARTKEIKEYLKNKLNKKGDAGKIDFS